MPRPKIRSLSEHERELLATAFACAEEMARENNEPRTARSYGRLCNAVQSGSFKIVIDRNPAGDAPALPKQATEHSNGAATPP